MKLGKSKSKILVVDDEIKACGLLKKFLERKNYSVETANSGEEALHKINELRPSCRFIGYIDAWDSGR